MTALIELTPAHEARGFKLIQEQASTLRSHAANPKQRIPTGIPSLDIVTKGVAPGEVFMVVGRSYTGKSLLATQVMANNPDIPLIFFSLEMTSDQCLTRLYGQVTDTNARTVEEMVERNDLPQSMERELAPYVERHVIVDKSGLTLGDMSAYLEAYEAYFGERPVYVIIDYLEEVGGGKSTAEGWIRTEATASALKAWAKDEEVAVLCLHQTNKNEPPYEPPTEDSPKGGGFVESDFVVGIWRPGRNPELGDAERRQKMNDFHMNVLKNRPFGRTWHDMRLVVSPSLRLIDMDERKVRDWYKH